MRLRVFGVILALVSLACASTSNNKGIKVKLRDGWAIQSSCKLQDKGETISRVGYQQQDWMQTTVPHTVLGAQVDAGLFKDPYFGTNLRSIPGTDYPLGKIYANLPTTEGSPYQCSWWYRTEFAAPFAASDETWVRFNGINYRANIWVNGQQIATSDDVAGAYRAYEFEIGKHLKHGQKNAIAVEVFIQGQNDLGINFVDWNHAPADKSLGLWRDVYLTNSGTVKVRNPAVTTRFVDDQLSAAELTVVADVSNASGTAIKGVLRGTIEGIRFEQPVGLAANESKVVRFTAEQFPQLRVENPKVWWPYQYGAPNLQTLRLAFTANGVESDAQSVRFGIREVQGDLNEKGFRQFRINRRNILIKGAGYAPEMFYRESPERIRHDLQYVKHMNLNTVRLEGKLGDDVMFDMADEMGILIMAGWCCCDHWEHWDKWAPKDHDISKASLHNQISRLRQHPSVFVWLNGSDGPPPADVESSYIAVLKERDWVNPFVSSASAQPTKVTGPSGVKMSGPYDYVPPEYWTLDKDKLGGGYGFNTETSPGPAVPNPASIKKTLPQQSWWPIDDQWNFHAGIGKFAQYNIFTSAMNATYGEAKTLEDYTRKSQLLTYDGQRAMFEAYSGNKYTSTGVIQWMLNNAWPSFIWHLYDYYLVPAGGFFGTRKANEPLHVQFRYADRTVQVVNSTLRDSKGLRVSAKLVDTSGKPQFSKDATVDLPADSVVQTFAIPEQSTTAFLKLEVRDAAGKPVSDNFYWLPAKLSTLDWTKSNYFYTPATQYADMRDLNQMAPAKVRATFAKSANGKYRLRVSNVGSSVAFFLHARAVKAGTDEDFAPVFWDDNFVSLLPGESRELTAAFAPSAQNVELKLDGWNLQEQAVRLH